MDRVWQGATLRKLRMLARKSITDVAEVCGVNQSTPSQWELGLTNPKREHLERMAALYDMPPELLLYEIGWQIKNPPSLRAWYKARSALTEKAPSGNTLDAPDASVASGPDAAALGASYFSLLRAPVLAGSP